MQDLTTSAVARELEAGYGPVHQDLAASLCRYLRLLLAWNRKMNLVGPKDWRHVLRTLVLDSLHLADCLQERLLPREPLCLDIGAGAGIPGIPLRLAWRPGTYLLVEPRAKRATFLRYASASLDLGGTRVLETRAEDLPPEAAGADLLLSRAFRSWADLLGSLGHLLAPSGLVLVFSNRPWPVEPAPPAGWRLAHQHEYSPEPGRVRYFWFFSPSI